jgi:hypothetical protein
VIVTVGVAPAGTGLTVTASLVEANFLAARGASCLGDAATLAAADEAEGAAWAAGAIASGTAIVSALATRMIRELLPGRAVLVTIDDSPTELGQHVWHSWPPANMGETLPVILGEANS